MSSPNLHLHLKDIEVRIGLEIHIQLQTQGKVFSPEGYRYGDPPNVWTHPISLGYPGTLPRLREEVLQKALKLALALECKIHPRFHFSRKNYFYPDLPKGYQITQYDAPYAENGILWYLDGETWKSVRVLRIQIEEDTGKSIHDLDPYATLLDFNRAGVPLLEIVLAPDLHSPTEADACLRGIRSLVRILGIGEANMEEGSLRCDANVSVVWQGKQELSERVEIKNLNSFRFLREALEYEIRRQIHLQQKGIRIQRETRGYDPGRQQTFPMRTKEHLHDYRYFPEPDLPPVEVEESWLEQIRAEMPPLPRQLWTRLRNEWELPQRESRFFLDHVEFYQLVEFLIKQGIEVRDALRWVLGPIRSQLNRRKQTLAEIPFSWQDLVDFIRAGQKAQVPYTVWSSEAFPRWWESPERLQEIVAEFQQESIRISPEEVQRMIRELLKEFPEKVEAYRKGKKGLLGFFMGQLMRRLGDRRKVLSPAELSRWVQEALEARETE